MPILAVDLIVGVYGLASVGVERDFSGRVFHAEVRAGDQEGQLWYFRSALD